MQMESLKSFGPDGFEACFYHKHWHLIDTELSSTVLKILQGAGTVSCFNSTYIPLISKISDPHVVTDFRPISLCNVIYKLV